MKIIGGIILALSCVMTPRAGAQAPVGQDTPCPNKLEWKVEGGIPYLAPEAVETVVCLNALERPDSVRFRSRETKGQWLQIGARELREEGYFLEERDLVKLDAGRVVDERHWFKSWLPWKVINTHRLMKSVLAVRQTRASSDLKVPSEAAPAKSAKKKVARTKPEGSSLDDDLNDILR